MVQINFAQKQVTAKIVYYGPGMSGKTTNLEVIHQRAPEPNKGDLTSISTDGDRTLFFDFMPLDLGTVAGMRTCFQIYTVPGQVYYNSTRKLVLQGVDGVVFIADSGANAVQENLESLRNLEENLNEYGKSLATLPHVIQYNKRDLPDALPLEQLNQMLNAHNAPNYEAIASTGQGVFPTLKALAARVLESIHTGSPSAQAQAKAPAARPGAPLPNMPQPMRGQPAPVGAQASVGHTGFQAQPGMPPAMGGQPLVQQPYAQPGFGGPVGYPAQAPHAGMPQAPQGAFGSRPGAFAQPPMQQPGLASAAPMAPQHSGGMPAAGYAPQGYQQNYQAAPMPPMIAGPSNAGSAGAGLNMASRQSMQGGAPRPTAPRAAPSTPNTLEGTRFKPRQAPRQEVKATPTKGTGKVGSNPMLLIVLAVVGVGALAAIVLSFL